MRIIHGLHSLDLGGTAKTSQIFVSELVKSGHEVMVLAKSGGPREKFLAESGAKVLISPEISEWERAFNGCDVVHLHGSGLCDDFFTQVFASAKKQGIRTVFTNVFGGYDVNLFRHCDQILCVSKTLVMKMGMQHGAARTDARISYLYNPIEIGELTKVRSTGDLRKELKIPQDAFLVSRIGRPDLGKWDHAFELAIRQLADKKMNVVALIQEAPRAVVKRIMRSRYAPMYRFLPMTSDTAQLVKVYAASNALLHTSSIGETFGCTLAEAQACGCPVVVKSTPPEVNVFYRDDAQTEVVQHGVTGYIGMHSGDLVRAVEVLIQTKEPEALRQQARNSVLRFDSKEVTARLIEAYAHNLDPLSYPELRSNYAKTLNNSFHAAKPDSSLWLAWMRLRDRYSEKWSGVV
jgi:glycosyltransferase involved in cell wall biosynthesis